MNYGNYEYDAWKNASIIVRDMEKKDESDAFLENLNEFIKNPDIVKKIDIQLVFSDERSVIDGVLDCIIKKDNVKKVLECIKEIEEMKNDDLVREIENAVLEISKIREEPNET